MPSIKSRLLSATADFYVKACKLKNSCKLSDRFTVTCHAGALLTKPNTLHSVREAVEWGADIVEFDVSFRPDGTPVIIHNSNPDINQGEFLENALEIVAESKTCKINLDLKSTANVAAVDDLVKRFGLMSRVFYTGVFADWVDAVKKDSAIPYYLNHGITETEATDKSAALEVAAKAKSFGAFGINSNFKNASKLFVETMHEQGLLVSLWTVNTPKEMIETLRLKPDNITTKKPNILRALIK